MIEKRKPWIDNLYAIGLILVVLGHSHPSDWSSFSGTGFERLINFLYIFHMPLFFYIAGFLFWNSDRITRLGYRRWLKEKIIRLLTPYVILSVLAMLPKYYIEHNGFAGLNLTYLMQAVFVPRIGVWGHFWFLPVLLLMYVAAGALHGILRKESKLPLILLTMGSLILFMMPIKTDFLGMRDFCSSAIYFCAGLWLRELSCSFRISVPARLCLAGAAAAFVWMMVEYAYRSRPTLLIAAFMMLFSCRQVALAAGDCLLLRYLSNRNFTIYLYSWPAQAAVMMIATKLCCPWPFTTLLMFLSGMLAPIILLAIYEKLPWLQNRIFHLLLGVR